MCVINGRNMEIKEAKTKLKSADYIYKSIVLRRALYL